MAITIFTIFSSSTIFGDMVNEVIFETAALSFIILYETQTFYYNQLAKLQYELEKIVLFRFYIIFEVK